MHGHYLLLFHHFSSTQREQLLKCIQSSANDWFNYTPDAFLLCARVSRPVLLHSLQALAPGPTEHFVLLDVTLAQVVGGLLPEPAWLWLRKHGLMHNAVTT